ncbi:MAG: DGQHR domain-containing protein [Dongiaceae bacterium]
MPKRRRRTQAQDTSHPDLLGAELDESETGEVVSYTAVLIIQGRHRFYTLTMPSDVLAENCTVDVRAENPTEGFQRRLDERRAREIAEYIDKGFGTIPGSIVLSAQPDAHLQYTRRTRTLSFRKHPKAFLILDGQHRVYGFSLATARLRVPVVIYNNLSKADEVRLFIDINTKQRPVPSELLLDISRLAETETDTEALLRDVFDLFDKEPDSPLLGLMSPSEKTKGKISRVTFNAALRAIWNTLEGSEAHEIYGILKSYFHACVAGLRNREAEGNITNPTLFRALVILFPAVAERVSDRHGLEYTTANFDEILGPLFRRIKKTDLAKPGASYTALVENFSKALRSGFSLRGGNAV